MIVQDAEHRFVSDVDKQGWSDKYTKNEVDNKFSALETKLDWKEAVETFADIAKTYPNPEDGWTVNVKDEDVTYRYTGNEVGGDLRQQHPAGNKRLRWSHEQDRQRKTGWYCGRGKQLYAS